MHCFVFFCFFFSSKASYCTFYLSGLFYSLRSSCGWMSVYECARDHHWTCYRFWFSACCWFWLGSMYLFTVMTWRCLFVLFFFFFFNFLLCCLCILFSSQSTLISWFCFVWLLTMSWLNASKSYTNWTIKDILNSEKLPFLLFSVIKLKRASSEMRNVFFTAQNGCSSSDKALC